MCDLHRFRLLLMAAFIAFGLGGWWMQASASQQDTVVSSWQVANPVTTGIVSALTFGAWPKEYGADARHKPATLAQNAGYGVDAFGYLRRHNEAIFRGYRSGTQWLMVLLALFGSAWLIHARRKGRAQ